MVSSSLQQALKDHPWEASDWFKKKSRGRYSAQVNVDALGWEENAVPDLDRVSEDRVQDVPVSWDMDHRQYHWRPVKRYWVPLGEGGRVPIGTDWMAGTL